MEMLNMWFHWVFPSPEYFLLAVAGLGVLFGLIGGFTESRASTDAESLLVDEKDVSDEKTWWMRDEEHYREWHAHQVREQHRAVDKH